MQDASLSPVPHSGTAYLALADGRVFCGQGFGLQGQAVGELVFNTAMTGYQEIMSDPSYAGQIITFTCPHIGNTGVNTEDVEATAPAAKGLVVKELSKIPSSWRQSDSLANWCSQNGLVGIAGVDTRAITQILREEGAQSAAIAYSPNEPVDQNALVAMAKGFSGLNGLDLVPGVSSTETSNWAEADWWPEGGYRQSDGSAPHIVVIDYGVKRNILRMLAMLNCRVSVVPPTASLNEIAALMPDGIVLSNGPGDPAATGTYAVPVIQSLLKTGLPMMGICLGHQMLGLAIGAKTIKMSFGHHGANHPVMDRRSGQVEITSQNHGFAIASEGLPDGVEVTHHSLFDGTIQGIALRDRPVYSIQYHPEASPGPTDSRYLFQRLIDHIQKA